MNVANKLLNIPSVYKFAQLIFAPGAQPLFNRQLKQRIASLPAATNLLDVGCGPSSWLWNINLFPVGLDISYEYSRAFLKTGEPAITGSAFEIPFQDNVFDGVWCIGVLHHLQDTQAEQAIQEMIRVCRPGGYIIVEDAVLPVSWLHRPIAVLVRFMDRGRYMRTQQALTALLTEGQSWAIRRFTYTLNGLEMLECYTRKQEGLSQSNFMPESFSASTGGVRT